VLRRFLSSLKSEQFQQALTYAAQTIDASVKNSDITGQTNTFSVTGHSAPCNKRDIIIPVIESISASNGNHGVVRMDSILVVLDL
jgi:hypothetical protein